jgi:hypothetical protein
MTPVLSTRALNRATLSRQLLLDRVDRSVLDTVSHLVGVQAQAPDAPYVTLWSRLAGFATGDLASLITTRQVARMTLMRGTLHLASAADCRYLRGVIQPVLERLFRSMPFAKSLAGADLAAVVDAGTVLIEQQPLTKAQLGSQLRHAFPDADPTALGYAVAILVPAIQVPPRGVWGSTGPAALTTLAAWLSVDVLADPTPHDAVVRYLTAFGPASVADISAWSGLSRLREVTESLDLRRFTDEAGRELLDVPDGERPDPETPAPVRFLAEYDNVLLSHADRTRIMTEQRRLPLPAGNGGQLGTFLLDGFLAGTWRCSRFDGIATLIAEPYQRLKPGDADAVEDEALRLLDFIAPDHSHHCAIAGR